jgi:hypothetical protein
MPRQHLLTRLTQADENIAKSDRHIQSQLTIVQGLERGGYDSNHARELLRQLEELQQVYVARKAEILSRLAHLKP